MSIGQIAFDASPWPQGHPLEKFRMTLKGDPQGNLRLHVHAVSAVYDASGDPQGAPAGSTLWYQPEVWADAGRAVLSSRYWDNAGFKLPSPRRSFTEDKLDQMVLSADPVKSITLKKPVEDLAVGTWVLGNGLAGDHRLTLRRRRPYVFDIEWTGRIRNSFLGEQQFDHPFRLTANEIRLS